MARNVAGGVLAMLVTYLVGTLVGARSTGSTGLRGGTTVRVFAALVPPVAARVDLADFLAPRWEAGRADGLRWTDPEQWHVTLAFAADVDDWRLEEAEERLAAAAARSPLLAGRSPAAARSRTPSGRRWCGPAWGGGAGR